MSYHLQWQLYYPSSISQPLLYLRIKAPFRAMILVAKKHHMQQVPIDYSDITALLLTLSTCSYFAVSVYISCSTGRSQDEPKLKLRLELLHSAYLELKTQMPNLELVVGGEFN